MKMTAWLILLMVLLLVVVVGFVASKEYLAARSNNVLLNVSTFPGGGENVTSTSVYGNMHIGEAISGFARTGSDVDARFGYFTTTNRTVSAVTGTNITVYAWNGSVWNSGFNVSFTSCTVGQGFCEPDTQNFTGNQSSLNITNTGTLEVTQILFSLNHTCDFVNFTYSNSTDLSVSPRLPLDTVDRLLWSNLSINNSFGYYVWANFTLPSAPCAAPATNYEVT